MTNKRILVDLNPQLQNQAAVSRAWQLARAGNVHIELFSSEYLHWLSGGPAAHDARMKSSRDGYLADLSEWLEAIAAPMRENGVDVSTHTVWHHPRHEAILQRAADIDASLIIRVARQHSKLERLFLSSTDWELIRHAPQAVWLVKSRQPAAKPLNVLAAVDPCHPDQHKAELDRHLLEAARDVCDICEGRLHILNAFEPPTAVTSIPIAAGAGAAAAPVPRVDEELVDAVRDMHRRRLKSLAEEFGVDEEHTHLVVGDAAAGVAEAVSQYDIGLVVVGAISRNWLQRWLVGSTTESIFDEVQCDVLVVKLEDNDNEQRSSGNSRN